jgi:hypothetical protein
MYSEVYPTNFERLAKSQEVESLLMDVTGASALVLALASPEALPARQPVADSLFAAGIEVTPAVPRPYLPAPLASEVAINPVRVTDIMEYHLGAQPYGGDPYARAA